MSIALTIVTLIIYSLILALLVSMYRFGLVRIITMILVTGVIISSWTVSMLICLNVGYNNYSWLYSFLAGLGVEVFVISFMEIIVKSIFSRRRRKINHRQLSRLTKNNS